MDIRSRGGDMFRGLWRWGGGWKRERLGRWRDDILLILCLVYQVWIDLGLWACGCPECRGGVSEVGKG